jgi:DNA-directed RNA polymerase subunit RPC12/RpoP
VILTTRSSRQVTSSLFPGSYYVYRNLCLRVPEGGIQAAPLRFSVQARLLPGLVAKIRQHVVSKPEWSRFRSINEDLVELAEPISVRANVAPTSWWCTNCNSYWSGALQQLRIRRAECPNCSHRSLVQFASIFMCPTCHALEPVERGFCNECGDSRNVVLEGREGRRRDYRWKCSRHPNYEQYVRKLCRCREPNSRMALKSTGGRMYELARVTEVSPEIITSLSPVDVNNLRFTPSRATVVDVSLGRIPIADVNNYYRRQERSIIEPFLNPATGNFIGFVYRLETDAITITLNNGMADEISLHSLKHALLNAAPAATGLVQDEFGANIDIDRGELIIYDNVQGGTGGCRLLVNRRLSRWLEVTRELAECHHIQCDEACRGCIFLPSRICRRANHSLDRHTVLRLIAPNI